MSYLHISLSLVLLIFMGSCGSYPPTYSNHRLLLKSKSAPSTIKKHVEKHYNNFDINEKATLGNPAFMPYYCNPYKYPSIAFSSKSCVPYLGYFGVYPGHSMRRKKFYDDDNWNR